jgi:hypothetical protein
MECSKKSLRGLCANNRLGAESTIHIWGQGCQMVYFRTENPNLGTFWRAMEWKMFCILWSFGIFYGHFVSFIVVWYILRKFGIFFHNLVCLNDEKSGNPVWECFNLTKCFQYSSNKFPIRSTHVPTSSFCHFEIFISTHCLHTYLYNSLGSNFYSTTQQPIISNKYFFNRQIY